MFFLFILSVSFCYGLFIYCSSVLCSLNQGIAAKEPCAQSISPWINNDDDDDDDDDAIYINPHAGLTSVVLHARVMRDTLLAEAEAEDVAWVGAVPHQEGAVRLPLQLHLSILPVHRAPVPTTLVDKHNQSQPTGAG